MRWLSTSKIILAGAGLALLAGLAYYLWPRPPAEQWGNLQTAQAEVRDISRMARVSGTIKSLRVIKVISPVAAKIKTLEVKDGDPVTKGQILMKLNADELTAKLAQANANYLKALSRFKEVKNWQTSPSWIEAKSALETGQMEFEMKQKEHEQNKMLYEAKAIAKQDLDRSQNEMERARVEVTKARAQLAQTLLKGGPEAFKEVKAELLVAELAQRDAEEALAHKDIKAPVAGVISFQTGSGGGSKSSSAAETALNENSQVSAGQVLFSIQSHEDLGVEAYVQESDALKLKERHPCMVSLPSLAGSAFPAIVESTSVEVSDKLSGFKVKCRIWTPPPDSKEKFPNREAVKVGMNAHVSIPLEKKTKVLLVPLTALVRVNNRPGVFLMAKGKPVFTEVEVGITSEYDVEILSGLQEGQTVLEQVPGELLKGLPGSDTG